MKTLGQREEELCGCWLFSQLTGRCKINANGSVLGDCDVVIICGEVYIYRYISRLTDFLLLMLFLNFKIMYLNLN